MVIGTSDGADEQQAIGRGEYLKRERCEKNKHPRAVSTQADANARMPDTLASAVLILCRADPTLG
jgi:hypothetical protein